MGVGGVGVVVVLLLLLPNNKDGNVNPDAYISMEGGINIREVSMSVLPM